MWHVKQMPTSCNLGQMFPRFMQNSQTHASRDLLTNVRLIQQDTLKSATESLGVSKYHCTCIGRQRNIESNKTDSIIYPDTMWCSFAVAWYQNSQFRSFGREQEQFGSVVNFFAYEFTRNRVDEISLKYFVRVYI